VQLKIMANKYNFAESEAKWQNFWQENQINEYEKGSSKPTFSIDTPPPTVS
jgi:valyl-tRNA synthetase